MKVSKMKIPGLLTMVALFIIPAIADAQQVKGNKNVVRQERSVQDFTQLEIGGAFEVFYTQSEKTSLVVEADENLMDNIQTKVTENKLKISSDNIKNAKVLKIYLSNPALEQIEISGAATLKSENTITGVSFSVDASGASRAMLNIEVERLKTKASGAADLKLRGSATEHDVSASGAAVVQASGLETNITDATASGASRVSINATKEVNSSSSGAGNISVSGNPEFYSNKKNIEEDTDFRRMNVESWRKGDTTTVKVGGVIVEVVDGDSTKVAIGNHSLVVDEKGNVEWKRSKKHKFKGHWAGFDLGVNGYVDKDFNLDVPQEYDFLTLQYEKSIDVNINFFEQNINLVNNKLGLVTGLGLRWNNYRFSNNVVLNPDSAQIFGYNDFDRDWRKSKLVVNYLTLPLFLEYQTNRFSKSNSFHIAAGAVLGWRYATHTKMLYFENGRQKPKQRNSFHLEPFRYDATVRIGWGIINLYATYSLNTLFKEGRGPELYPFAMGITFLNF
jgi:hypothetical protein